MGATKPILISLAAAEGVEGVLGNNSTAATAETTIIITTIMASNFLCNFTSSCFSLLYQSKLLIKLTL
jgi:hypothetical protein